MKRNAAAKRFMSYKRKTIWYYDGAYMVARGDGTDEYFTTWQDAMDWIDGNKKEERKMEQYSVIVQHKMDVKEGRWVELGAVMQGLGHRYYTTKAKALADLRAYLRKYNQEFKYDVNGQRQEIQPIGGGFTAALVHDKQIDDDFLVVAWKLRRRDVTPWETLENAER